MPAKILASSLLFASLLIIGCGNGGSPAPIIPKPLTPIDPSGNWTMTATDAGNHSNPFAALFAQTGSVVTANSFTAVGSPAPFTCVPFTASLSNGQVLNVNQFSGTITFGNNFGAFTFTSTLAPDGKSFSGTYSNMPPCTGLLSSGTFTGTEVPTMSGSWTGTEQACNYDQTTGICTVFGQAVSITANLSQDDVTGNVTGTYQSVGIVSGFSSGTVAVVPADQDILSGLALQLTATDSSGAKSIVSGGLNGPNSGTGLDLKGGFKGIVANPGSTSTGVYALLVISH